MPDKGLNNNPLQPFFCAPPRSIYQTIDGPNSLVIHCKGPALSLGPLPAIFYFTSTGEDSLLVDPFNQPAVFLEGQPVRFFSFTLPYHGKDVDNKIVMTNWATELSQGGQFLTTFLEQCIENITHLIDSHYIEPTNIAVAGLSRGAFVATHLAIKDPRIRTILGYAPLTTLSYLSEYEFFKEMPEVAKWELSGFLDQLVDKQIRYYIGNHDTRVGTDACFHFATSIVERAYAQKIRSPAVDFIMTPSIGHRGHGTAPEIFLDGMNWLINKFTKSV
jgi:pimeloyl-ACP methyl ester carboxylesterase